MSNLCYEEPVAYDTTLETGTFFEEADIKAWRVAEEKLLEFSSMKGDANVAAPSPRIVACARDFMEWRQSISFADPPYRVTTTPDGGILFEWHWPQYTEAEISESELAEWMQERADGSFDHWDEAIPHQPPHVARDVDVNIDDWNAEPPCHTQDMSSIKLAFAA